MAASATRLFASRLWIVSPLYFDTESYVRLLEDLTRVLAPLAEGPPHFVTIDDSAGIDPEVRKLESDARVRVVTPPFNLGHQRAIVYGLRRLGPELRDDDVVVTMDADGEDRPSDLPALLGELLAPPAIPSKVVLARRTSRHVSPGFRVLYSLFVILFRSLTGTLIRTGNFAAYRGWVVRHVLAHPHFDLCYSASLLSLNLLVRQVPCPRGRRYAGASKMNALRLASHGIAMLMPFLDRVAVRALAVSAGAFALGIGSALAAALMAASNQRALPAWSAGVITLMLALSLVAVSIFILLFSLHAQAQGAALRRLDEAAPPRAGEAARPDERKRGA